MKHVIVKEELEESSCFFVPIFLSSSALGNFLYSLEVKSPSPDTLFFRLYVWSSCTALQWWSLSVSLKTVRHVWFQRCWSLGHSCSNKHHLGFHLRVDVMLYLPFGKKIFHFPKQISIHEVLQVWRMVKRMLNRHVWQKNTFLVADVLKKLQPTWLIDLIRP